MELIEEIAARVGVRAERGKRFGHKDANYIGSLDNAATIMLEHVQPGDLVLTLGAGTVNRIADQLLGLLKEKEIAHGSNG